MKTILIENETFLVDDNDEPAVLGKHWWLNHNGYARGFFKTGEKFLHEFLIGKAPEGFVIHHKDENKRNNQRDNLEIKTKSEHTRFHENERQKNNDGYKGVYLDKRGRTKPWVARIYYNSGREVIGSFLTDAEAARAYDKRAVEVLGAGCYLNFPIEANV